MSCFLNNVILDLICVFVEKSTLRKSSIIFKNEHNFQHNLETKSGTFTSIIDKGLYWRASFIGYPLVCVKEKRSEGTPRHKIKKSK